MRRALCLPVLALSVLSAQQPVERSYDLSELLRPLPGVSQSLDSPLLLLPLGRVLPTGESGNFSFLLGGDVRSEPVAAPWLPPRSVLEWLVTRWDEEGVSGDTFGSTLTLRAPNAVHTQVRDLVALLHAIREQRSRITLFELEGRGETSAAAVLSQQEVADLLAQRAVVQATAATIGHDVPWLYESGSTRHFVRDLDVEVAEKALISDPKLDVFFEGTRAGLALTPMIDGRFLVRVGVQASSQHGDLVERQLEARQLGVVQLPQVDVESVTASAVLASGGGLLLAADGGRRAWLLRVDSGAPAKRRFGMAAAVPLGDLAVAPLGPGPRVKFAHRPGDDRSFHDSRRESPDAFAALDAMTNGAVDRDAGHAQFASHAILLDASGPGAAIEAALQRHAATVQSTSLTFRLGAIDKGRGLAALRGDVDVEALASALPHEVRVATLPGHAFHVRRGREIAFVRDYEVEIASKASVANPVIGATFDGFQVSGVLRRRAEGSELQVRLEWGAVTSIPAVNLQNGDLGSVDTPQVAWTDVACPVDLDGAGWQVVHVGPDPQTPAERSLVLMVRAR
ncbi:MAG: hypothetical protein KAI24_01145 [Planctomycetes bacterium]|nr:hypothetical protein [Planctomycetota bacterium]